LLLAYVKNKILGIVRRSFHREQIEEKQEQQEEAQIMPRILPHASVLQPLAEVQTRRQTKTSARCRGFAQ